jgi:hypothetical protein
MNRRPIQAAAIPARGDGPVEQPFDGTPQVERTGCTQQQIYAQHGLCDAEYAQEKPVYDDDKSRSDSLRTAIYGHNLAIGAYEQHLAAFEGALAVFQAALASYMGDLAGRTYTTTALDDEANQLDAARTALSVQRDAVMTEYTTLQDESATEKVDKDTLSADVRALIQELSDFLQKLKCGVTCGKVSALLAQAQTLLAASNFSVRDPSAAPSDIPIVPRLPAPPHPGSSGYARPTRRAPHPRVILSSGFNGKPNLIQAGEIWPKSVPLEGAVRLAIGSIYWEWAPVPPGAKITAQTPGVRPAVSGHYGIVQYKFQPGSQPAITVGGGLPVTDVRVSSNGACVFFTLYQESQEASAGTYDITVRADDGTLIELKSPDKGTSLTFETDASLGLAGFQSGLAVAVASTLDAASSATKNTDLLNQWDKRLQTYEEALLRLLQRSAADTAAWAAKIDLTRAMFRPESLYDWSNGLWDFDADMGMLDGLWTDAQYDIFERETFLSRTLEYWPHTPDLDRVRQVLRMVPLQHRLSPPISGPDDLMPAEVDA